MKTVNTLQELIRTSRDSFQKLTAVMNLKNGTEEYESHTYGELYSDAKRVGKALRSMGLAGKKIIICGENGYEWVTAYLAVTGYCGVAVPLSRTLSREDLSDAAKHCDAEAIIYGNGCEELADAMGEGIRIPFSSLDTLNARGKTPEYTPKETDPAELAYSSGTEGKAHAVVLSHKNICHSINALTGRLKLTEKDRFYSVLPLTHINERVFGLLCPLFAGASVAYGNGLHKITENMRKTEPTVVLCVPFILDKIYSKINKNIREKNKTAAVRQAVKLTDKVGSFKKALRKMIFAQIHASLGGRLRFFFTVGDSAKYRTLKGLSGFGISTVQGYGLTESAALISISEDSDDFKSVGKPIEAGLTDIYNIQSDGVGEIRYKGDNVTSGYYNDIGETAEHIRGGWLYTGDMGYLDTNGLLHIVGRRGNIISTSRNKQIYPEELEARLVRSPFVKECAVIGIPDARSGDYSIVAVIYPSKAKFTEVYGSGYTNATVYSELEAAVDAVNDTFREPHKQINHFSVTDREFTKTSDGKIIRALIEKEL